jgi:hypothetical protein
MRMVSPNLQTGNAGTDAPAEGAVTPHLVARRRGEKAVPSVHSEEGACPVETWLLHVQQQPAITDGHGIVEGERLVILPGHLEREAAGAEFPRGIVDAQFG